MKSAIEEFAGPVLLLAVLGVVVAVGWSPPRTPPQSREPAVEGGLVSPANDVARRNAMEQEVRELRGRVEALEEDR